MSLDRSQLQTSIIAAMERPLKPDQSLTDENRQFAIDLANAIDAFVRGGDVTGVRVKDHEDRTLDQTGHGSVT